MTETAKKKPHKGILALLWCGVVVLVGLLVFTLLSAFGALRFWQAEKQPQGETDLRFTAAELPFTHEADLVNSLPFLASAALDIDGDGRDELFLGGGDAQADGFFAFKGGKFVPLNIKLEKGEVDATHGVVSLDLDNDGDLSLIHI